MCLKWIELPEIDSTTAYIKRNPHLLKENNFLVFSFNQTAGKGQNERPWLSQKNKDIAFTFIFHPHESVSTKHISCITLYVGLAVLRVLRQFSGVDLQIKWPNDIQYSCNSGVDKKLAGILCELLIENGKSVVLVGVGVNVNSTSFDAQITPQATSVKILAKQEIKIKELLLKLRSEVTLILEGFALPMRQALIKEILHSFSLLGKEIVYIDDKKNKINAVVLGIDPFGLLMAKDIVSKIVYKIDHNTWLQ